MPSLREATKKQEEPKPTRGRVLVVDDESGVHAALDLVLQDFEVLHALSGHEGLLLLRSINADAIILDMKMPEMSGIEFGKRLRTAGDNTPIVVLTAHHDEFGQEDVYHQIYPVNYIVKGEPESRIEAITGSAVELGKALRELEQRNAELRVDLAEVAKALDANPFLPKTKVEETVKRFARGRVDTSGLVSRHERKLTGGGILLTGATGWLGKRLLHEFLAKTDATLFVLMRDKKGRDGRVTVPFDSRLAISSADRERVVMLRGDITESLLGLCPSDLERVEREVGEVWHSAASTNFEEQLRQQTYQINEVGITNVLDVARRIADLRAVNQISTAYVAGTLAYPGVAPEEVTIGRGAKNPYERSKQIAEVIVASSGLPWRIFRPSIIVGDSRTGESDNKTMYGFAMIMALASRMLQRRSPDIDPGRISVRIVGDEVARKNYIPIDIATDLILRIREAEHYPRQIYHIVHPDYQPMGQLVRALSDRLGLGGYVLDPCLTEAEAKAGNLLESVVFSKALDYQPYMQVSDPEFDASHTLEAVGSDYPWPRMDDAMIGFLLDKFFETTIPELRSKVAS